ncbi:unnamed protein product [Echinostoma caproni]|uniref:RING-type domain-containing protein n=1 Tax=Echinostoma caproni TaxID=27848 RepID=A0A183ASI4_9TREM|nr:unnamed protein product [Echinostoma caproni]
MNSSKICRANKYNNPQLKLMVNTCGHSLCENCVEVLFARGSGLCVQCKTPIRKANFRYQLFEDPLVQKEVELRKKILSDFNKREDDFDSLEDLFPRLSNDVLVFNLMNDIDVDETKKYVEQYKKENKDIIKRNRLRPVCFGMNTYFVKNLFIVVYNLQFTKHIPSSWGKSLIVPIFKKKCRNDCRNHRGSSLIPIVTKVPASVILRRLTPFRETNIREQQAGFRPGRGCIDQIFTLRQILELRHAHRRPTIAMFLDLKGAFDSVDRDALMGYFLRKGMPQKYFNLLRSLYSHTSSRERVYNNLSRPFVTSSGVRQGCPLSPYWRTH